MFWSETIDYTDQGRDPLTDLPNRTKSLREVRRHFSVATLHCGGISLLLLNLDRFKDVNEWFGHDAGDDILRKLCLRSRSLSVIADFIGRLGGDEFVFILGGRHAETAEAFAQTLLDLVSQPVSIDGRAIRLRGSVGIASCANTADSEAVFSRANFAMTAAKAGGGSLVKVYDPGVARARQRELQLRFDLESALERNEFAVYYQPKVSLSSGKISGAEALIRWHHPTLGLVLPGEFIRIAEESRFIGALGKWVIDQALSDLDRWSMEGDNEFTLSINVSPHQLADPDFPSMLSASIVRRRMLPARVELEVTEGILLDASASEWAIREIQRLGVSIALDDFGTGYCNLSYITQFPVNTIKIDRSFVYDLGEEESKRGRIVVAAVIALCKLLGLHTLAEGVETEEQKKVLEEAGCDSIQGYFISPALPAEAFIDFVKGYKG